MSSKVMKVVVGDTEPTRRYVGQVWLDLSVPATPVLRVCVDVDEALEADRWVDVSLSDHTHA